MSPLRRASRSLRELERGGWTSDKKALRRIERAIELHLRAMRENGLKIPRPRHRALTPRRTSRQVDFYATVEIAA